jgi:streptogramin lyase
MDSMKRPRDGLAVVSLLIALSLIPGYAILYRPQSANSAINNTVFPLLIQQYPSFTIANYSLPTPNGVPDAIVAGLNHKLWFTEYGAGKIGEFDSVNKNFTEYSIPYGPGATPATLAFYGPDEVWFTDQNPSFPSVWSFNTTSHMFHRFLTNATNSSPVFVLADRATGGIWFTDTTAAYLGEINTATLQMTKFSAPATSSGPLEIAQQNGTSYLWVTEISGKIARFDKISKTFQEATPSVPLSYPVGIVVDEQGGVWVSEHGGSSVAEYIPSNSTWKKYPTSQATHPPGTGPATLAIDSLGRLWFAEHYANKIGRLDPETGSMEEFNIPVPGAYSLLNSLDQSGNFWFAEADGNSIGIIPENATSSISIRPVSASASPVSSGQTITSQFLVTNDLATQITFNLNVTSFFTTNYYTTRSEMSLSTYSLTLTPGQNKTVTATVTPDFSLPSGIYTAGLVASYDNVSTIGSFFLQVNTSPLYQLETILPEILIGAAAILAVSLFLLNRRKTAPNATPPKPVPKLSLSITVLMLLFFFIQQTGNSWAKCPGLPPPPVNPNGPTVDYYGIALDLASIAFFGVVAYILIRGRLRKGKPAQQTPAKPPAESVP